MRPRALLGILVSHSSGAAAYMVYLEQLKKVVTSSAVSFDDIPREISFLANRPDHWVSPAPGIDDAAQIIEEEEIAMQASNTSPSRILESHSIFYGRDIPRPPVPVHGESQEPIKAEEKEDEQGDRMGPELRRSTWTRTHFDPQWMPSGTREMEDIDRLIEEDSSEEENNFSYCMSADSNITMEKAMAGDEAGKWREAIQSEDLGLEERKVITTEKCPAGIRPLKTRYVLSKKRDPSGTEEHYKARRVVQGFHQVYGRDFLETFAPVVGFNA